MNDCESNYNSFKYIRKIPYDIISKLITDCPELWKLMKYIEPMGKPELSSDEILEMICPDSMNVEKYNVVFQKYSQEAMIESNIFAQIRLQILNNQSINNLVSRVSVVIEIIVNQKQMVCQTDYTPYDNRAMAITQAIIETLNGKFLNTTSENNGNYMFINGQKDASTGFRLVNFNKEFSGYQLIMDTNITG